MDFKLAELKNVMVAQTYKNDLVANNLANMNTSGYKRDVMFIEILKRNTMPEVQLTVETDFSQGPFQQTGNSLDLAISGRGFFVIEIAEGVAYTREGHFEAGRDGILRTVTGNPVLGQGGWINLSTDGIEVGEISVSTVGDIRVDDQYIDTLRVMDFDSYSMLKKVGENLFLPEEEAISMEVEEPDILQGQLEGSNVNPVQEMISLIELQRQFESSQRAVKTIDNVLRKVANDIGRYR